MRKPGSVASLEQLGRVRLSKSFFMRDFLYSEIANFYGMQNFPDDPARAIEAGRHLCEELLEPLQQQLGRLSIRSGYRSCKVNETGVRRHNCASNESNYAVHIWDRLDGQGRMGATACVVVNSFIPYYERTGDWEALAWWVDDNLPSHSGLQFFPKLAAFNISWREKAEPSIYSYIPPRRGYLRPPGVPDGGEKHPTAYSAFLATL